MSVKKILLIGFIFVLLAAIPLTVYLVQQEQKTQSGAQQKTTLSLVETPQTVHVGDNVKLDVVVNPGENANQVSFVKFTFTYDSTKLEPVNNSCSATGKSEAFCPNGAAFSMPPMQGPNETDGKVSVTLSTGNSIDKVIKKTTIVGTINFRAKATTERTTVQFLNKPDTEILSIGSNDQFNENVLMSILPAVIIIVDNNQPTASPTTAPTASPTAGPTGTPQTTVVGPTCTSLTIDPSTNGTAPYSVNLTANGQSSNSMISNVTFDFGDGQTQNATNSAGTDSVSILQSHIYNDPGNYTATATLTDASGNVSPIGNCSVSISVDNGEIVMATPTATLTPLENEQTGPRDLITIGSIGAIITVIGAILLLAL
jgi:hypothetical protein